MSKTIKIKNFLDNNAKKYFSRKKYSSLFQDKIRKVMNEVDFESESELLPIQGIIIKKINDDLSEPLLYKIFNKLNYPNDKIKDKQYFLSWYRENSINIDLEKLISSLPEYYQIIFNPIEERKKLHELFYNNHFIFLDIIHCGEIYDLVYNKYSNSVDSMETNVYLYHIKDDIGPNMSYIIKIIDFFRKISKKYISVDLTIFFCNQKRSFHFNKDHKKILTPENINGGSTISGVFVYVWRKEEFYKVLIHELIHYFKLDFHDIDNSYIEKIRNSVINIEGIDVANETYTELLAITIHSIWYSIIKKVNFNDIINYENLFTHFQIAKLIYFYGGKKYRDLFRIKIKQKTSVASYVIIKGMFLNNYHKILDHYDNFFNISKKSKFEDYKRLYKEIANKESLNESLINHYLTIIENTFDKDKFVFNSFRMTMFDIL
jgi:hypothetical protein